MKKIVITGKGGVGKTTIIATLSRLLSRDGHRVMIIDTDPSMNLAMSMDVPLSDVLTLAAHKTEIRVDADMDDDYGGDHHSVKINFEDVLKDFTVQTSDNVRLIVMGTIPFGGAGCICSSVAMVKLLVEYMASNGNEYDFVIVDSQAGSEILGRGLAADYDYNVVVTEAVPKAIDVAKHVMKLAVDLKVKRQLVVVNKVGNGTDAEKVANALGIEGHDIFTVRHDRKVMDADKDVVQLLDMAPDCEVIDDIRIIKDAVCF
jgi:CO dehydrogenase maturation factor